MLTKARLDQYIKDNELVPIGTELETIELGKCKVVENQNATFPYRCQNEKGFTEDYGLDFRWETDYIHSSLLDPTPSTVENPFSKEMLEQMVSDVEDIRKVVGYSDTRGKIISTCNHLLTNANEFPKMMSVNVGLEEEDWISKEVEFVRNGLYFVKIGDCEYIAHDNARPIEQKPKELKDLVEKGSELYAIDVCLMDDNKTEALGYGKKYVILDITGTVVYFDTKHRKGHGFQLDELHEFFQLAPPTSEQITAAEESAINEVKARFDKARKEVGNG